MESISRMNKKPTKPKRRSQAERRTATRPKLLNAAIDCLYELGFNGATLSVVAERDGVRNSAPFSIISAIKTIWSWRSSRRSAYGWRPRR